MSGLFCVTSFRTRGCTPCAAMRLSLRTLWAEQFADANSTAHKVLNMSPQTVYRFFGRRSFCFSHQFLRKSCTMPKQKTIPEWKPKWPLRNARLPSSSTDSSLKTAAATMRKATAAKDASAHYPRRGYRKRGAADKGFE